MYVDSPQRDRLVRYGGRSESAAFRRPPQPVGLDIERKRRCQ